MIFSKLRAVFGMVAVIVAFNVGAQIVTPVTWQSTIEMTSATEGKMIFKAHIDDGWHLYGLNLPSGGPRSTRFDFTDIDGASLIGDIVPSVAPIEKVDRFFDLKLSWWESDVAFTQLFKLDSDSHGCRVSGTIEFQGCNSKSCIPPSTETFELSVGSAPAAVDKTEVGDTVAASGIVGKLSLIHI